SGSVRPVLMVVGLMQPWCRKTLPSGQKRASPYTLLPAGWRSLVHAPCILAESLISARFCERLRASTKARFPAAVRERRFLWASAATTDLIDRTATLGCNCMTCPRNTKVRAQLPALHMLAAAMLLASGAQAKAPVDWDLL